MKKALVYVKENGGRLIGDIERVGEAEEINKWTHSLLANGTVEKVDVPVALENLDAQDLKIGSAPDTWIKEGETDVLSDPNDITWTFVPSHDIIEAKVEMDYSAEVRISKKGAVLSTGVYDDLETTFSSRKTEVATANYLTALAMKGNPSFFAGKGIFVIASTTSFAIGDELTTELNVTDYSTELLADAEQYAVDRLLKYKTYMVDKAAIEAE